MPSSPRRPLTVLVRGGVALAVAATTALVAPGGSAAAAPATAPRTSPSTSSSTAPSAPSTATTGGHREPTVPASVVPRIRWGSCGPDFPAFQCASVEVPRDYDRPYGATTTLALTRLPAARPQARIGTLFTNPGGPGGSGVDFVQSGAQVFYPQAIRDRFDILGFDPRGVARSDPATCFATAAQEQQVLAGFPAFPLSRAEVPAYLAANRTLARACAATSPARFDHMSSANVARDMDLLRRAVGDAKLSYAGYSYGTFLGATYASLFPHRIRALVLDGTLDPREYRGDGARRTPVGVRVEQDRGGAEVFGEFLRQCRTAGAERCSLAGVGDPATVARATLDELKATPRVLTLPDGSTLVLTYQLLVTVTFSSLYGPLAWADLADLYTLLAAVPARAERTAAPAAGPAVAALLRSAREGREDYPSFGGALSTCVDTRTPRPAVYPATADRQDRRFPDFGRYRTWIDVPCHYLKRAGVRDTDAYRGSWRQRTNARVLVLGTRFDPATPYRNTRPYADLFRRASVVTLEGWGHTTLGQSACTDARVTSYLLDPTRRRGDVRCATDIAPFAPAQVPAAAVTRAAAAHEALRP